ncbi:MAG: DUF499 domain-containing protein [Syntrophobacteraceae bacterium]|jgi:hypothetical protein
MALKPWYKVVTPREDLRNGRPLDASEFAVNLGLVRDGKAPPVYQNPQEFFERTYLTKNLLSLASEVVRRLSGERTETSAVFNMTTQFGGGKTHSLAMLYHLAQNGLKSEKWLGVDRILREAGIGSVPKSNVAVFVGTEFDSITGRGGDDGTPLRRTPWGEIAFQLGGKEAFDVVAQHEEQLTAPGGDVIRKFLPKDEPCLILMDELMNYLSRSRKSGLSGQFYNFLHDLSEVIRSQNNMVLAVSIPASELEMTTEDQADFERFKKLLDRLGKALFMSAEAETSEIIRRRLFEWDNAAQTQDGRVLLSQDAIKACNEYADWVVDHRQQLPQWFPIDHARETFYATYPFHPTVVSVFERKWRVLPRFQQTRGALRLLALWVSRVYQEGFKGGYRDPLIGLGSAPLDDSLFRAAMFEQLGEARLEGPITTDICGKKDSHSLRLDRDAVDAIRKSRLHQKIATTILFESNGGQSRTEATVPEVRLAVGDPELDIGNIETALEGLSRTCYYLSCERNSFRFSFTPNLNKLFADRQANVQEPKVQELIKKEIQKVFANGTGMERIFFPEKSSQIPDRPVLTMVIMDSKYCMEDKGCPQLLESMIREYGTSARTFKSALIWTVADSSAPLKTEARKWLAWQEIETGDHDRLDEKQRRELAENLKKGQRDLKESIWRTYRHVALLNKDNTLRIMDLGLIHSSAANSMPELILMRLRQGGDVEEGISANFLVRNWPPAFKEWSTKSVRDAFFASPIFPRILKPDVIKVTIAKGVSGGTIAYVAKRGDGSYDPFCYECALNAADVEISDDTFIITRETAEAYKKAQEESVPTLRPEPVPTPESGYYPKGEQGGSGGPEPVHPPAEEPQAKPTITSKLQWGGEIPSQKWMNFYQRVLSRFATGGGKLKIRIDIEFTEENGISTQKIEETKVSLQELGLGDDVKLR